MAAQLGSVTLLVMPPSGETFLARDAFGTVWLVHPPGAGGPEKVAPSAVDEAVARHGWDRVEESFGSWAELDTARQERVAAGGPRRPVDVSRYDEHDVRRVLRVVSSWLAAGDPVRGRPALHRLLRDAPVVREDDQLYVEVTELLVRLDQVPPTPPRTAMGAAGSQRHADALQRLQIPLAA